MARRPAYNTLAERARRAEARRLLLAEVTDAGDRAEELVPAFSAWIQLLRREHEYEAMSGRPYDRWARPERALTEQMRSARDHMEMAWSYAYAASAAHDAGKILYQRASESLLAALGNARDACPYSDAENAALKALYPEG